MKLSSLILKLTKHVIQIRNEDCSDTILLENTCYVYNGKLNGSTSLENDNMCYVSFKIREQENAYLGVVKFKTEDQKFLGRQSSLQFHLMPKMCGFSISFQGDNKECPKLLYKPFHSLWELSWKKLNWKSLMKNPFILSYEILYVSLLIYNWLSNWASHFCLPN